jgi:hypothetical protein
VSLSPVNCISFALMGWPGRRRAFAFDRHFREQGCGPLGAATSPVTRFEVFRAGRRLYEAETGLFEPERDRAFFLYADSEWFRRQQREVLRGGAG